MGGFGEQFYSTWFKDEFANKIRLCLKDYCVTANLENSAVATGLEKDSFIPIPKKGKGKELQTTTQFHSSHILVK